MDTCSKVKFTNEGQFLVYSQEPALYRVDPATVGPCPLIVKLHARSTGDEVHVDMDEVRAASSQTLRW